MTSLVMILAYLCGEDRKGIFIFIFILISGDINRILAEDAVNVPRNEEDARK